MLIHRETQFLGDGISVSDNDKWLSIEDLRAIDFEVIVNLLIYKIDIKD